GGLRIGRLHKEAPASAGRAWPAPVADPHLADPRSQPSGTLCRKGLSRCAACRGGAVRASNLRCSTASHALASIAVGIVIIIRSGGLRIGRLHKEAPASAGRAWPAPVADPHLADPRSQPSGTLCRKGLSRCAACRGGAVRASNLRCSTASHALASIAVGIVIII